MPYISVSHKQQGKIVHVDSLYSSDMQNFGVKENSILKGVLRGLKGQKLSSKYTLYYKNEFSYLRFFAPYALLYCSADYNETLVSCTH